MINQAKKSLCVFSILLLILGCYENKKQATLSTNWCDKELRPSLKKLTEIKTKRDWFKVYAAGENVYAIVEPYNYQEVISYLILGKQKALLFDTGMGMDSISQVVKELTSLPITVLNSHTHYDHIGGNYEFTNILGMDTAFTRDNAANGIPHDKVKQEVSPDAFCQKHLPKMDTANYKIKPFVISTFIHDGYKIDIGERTLKVISTAGHTPDAVALLDEKSGYLWCGDTFYEGPIFLFSKGTDLASYENSITKLSLLIPKLKYVFPAHNNPVCDPKELTDAKNAFEEIKSKKKSGKDNNDGNELFTFDKFSFLIGKGFLNQK
ncbi:MAG: MBL fold metallo-hydrolase [Bacteroidetes bacterium]|nr:MBL fold metallo-hydrolase [Bacteroidota bacterium]